MYLLDTHVISESRCADPRVTEWGLSVQTESLFLSVVTIFELERGTLSVQRRDKPQSALLREWLNEVVLSGFGERILPATVEIALRCAALHVPVTRPERDAWIAATALVHGMTVVTRNVADFEPMGVAVLNPWEYLG